MTLKEQGEVVHASNHSELLTIVNETKNRLVIVDFYANWCSPCVHFKPKYSVLAKEYVNKAVFVKVDIDETPESSQFFAVNALPTFGVFFNGKEQMKCEGALEEKLRSVIDSTIAKLNLLL